MNQLSQEEKYMQRCLQLAKMAEGNTYPNPMVGSVIVYNGKIIGEGYHRKAGEPHAEVNAVNSVKDKSLLRHSTLYVNLEPCAHYGKTPPCSKLIIDNEIPSVVIGCIDSFSEVAGKGVEMMRRAGVEVKVGVLEDESLELNRRFFTFHNKQRPYIILKWAETLDGFIDIDRTDEQLGRPTWITNEWARRAVHKQRASEQAILIGTHTALKDNPSLTLRDWAGEQPLRCVIDKRCQLDGSKQLLDGESPTVVYNLLRDSRTPNLEYVKLSNEGDFIDQILKDLWQRNIQSLIVEGGSTTLSTFIETSLWDEAYRYIGHVFFKSGVKAPPLNAKISNQEKFGSSELLVYRNNL
ncbi:bifunctional diaminohydroxyphosphoribosylaminopyrimidine deaminase/5-amino-6-(5-phosphoribosylamino)uracil reductase RibD [Carboxylicivirga taeanensis]|uniref:bifunctional diaminohydroxyphosphoribosylaminopyrimidine deaminase/5-amino-6-(5-phosphoribosylamino)uracil reductase RibD n=1 Tax=Carboxylicivirga taeanensis TaxID=1416875 RepID=UPI003F6DFACA